MVDPSDLVTAAARGGESGALRPDPAPWRLDLCRDGGSVFAEAMEERRGGLR